MDDMLDSITKKGRKFKQLMKGKKNKPDKTGVNTAKESIDSSGSLLRPVPHTAAGSHGGGGSRTSTDERDNHSRDRSPQPESVSVLEREAVADEKEASEGRSRQGGREAEGVHPSLSSTSIPHTGEPESAPTLSFYIPHLTVLPGNADTAAPDHAPEGIRLSENTESSAAANKKKPDWKSTASATAKLILRGVRDSADAFGPLKSVAGGLCFILENCEVRSSSPFPAAALTRIPAHKGE